MNNAEKLFFTIDDKEYCSEESILSILLNNNVLFCNQRYYSLLPDGKSSGQTIVLYVVCNDVFGWACADAEDITLNELLTLYKMWEADKVWGPAKWCCLKRNLKPQAAIEKIMKEDGVWNNQMDCLKENNSR